MADETTENVTEETNESTSEQPAEPTGGPDAQKAAEGYRKQRDEARAEIQKLQTQLEELQAKGDPDAYKAQLEEAKKQAEEAAKQAEYRRVNSVRLIKEGCVDVDVALGLLDENGDVEALKKAKPYLFGNVNSGSTGFKPGGASNNWDALDKAMGLK